jgi:hypothetical protein
MMCPECGNLRHDGDCVFIECADCRGKGEISGERARSGVNDGGPYTVIVPTVWTCETCGGWGKVPDEQ